MTPLRLRMIDAMVLRGFAARTQETGRRQLSWPPGDNYPGRLGAGGIS